MNWIIETEGMRVDMAVEFGRRIAHAMVERRQTALQLAWQRIVITGHLLPEDYV